MQAALPSWGERLALFYSPPHTLGMYVDGVQRLDINAGLLVEYAPGLVCAADCAAYAALRASLLAQVLGRDSIATTLSAMWVYTGYWPADRLIRICSVRAKSRTIRKPAPEERQSIAGLCLTTLPRTITDIFRQEALDVAITCALEVARQRLLEADEWEAAAENLTGQHLAAARAAVHAIAQR